MTDENPARKERKLGVLVGGSGLIGGALMHYFKTRVGEEIDLLAPNSKKLSLREPDDIRRYFRRNRPDFIINTAIAAIDSDAQLAYEVNYLGAINLARVAVTLGIPYIHFSSAAIMPNGENLDEEDVLPLTAGLSNYAKSKLLAEETLKHMHRTGGLDYTSIRLGVVYGKHDHKIQGFQRLFFSIMNRSMLLMLTRKGVRHSYTHAKKLPPFVHHVLDNRAEFSGRTYNFVDPEPVELAGVILAIKRYLGLHIPKEIYLPYPLAKLGQQILKEVVRVFSRVGVEARMPGELMFLENFYKTQTLSPRRLQNSSYRNPAEEQVTVYSKIPDLIQYYMARWEHLNLISSYNACSYDPSRKVGVFIDNPAHLLENIKKDSMERFAGLED
ncbi:MAG: NAD-dependent epimerase/dehydratase family protein [Desulfurivibrionaceae bacterium]|nr:NAD-dependent epimerase/dehydratase family protein [Desulfobulbales bacterium]MDT8334164.1 NAD-dependent epimerase/dehydratase family protein [Desulfurivibrionaceae bacterium]